MCVILSDLERWDTLGPFFSGRSPCVCTMTKCVVTPMLMVCVSRGQGFKFL